MGQGKFFGAKGTDSLLIGVTEQRLGYLVQFLWNLSLKSSRPDTAFFLDQFAIPAEILHDQRRQVLMAGRIAFMNDLLNLYKFSVLLTRKRLGDYFRKNLFGDELLQINGLSRMQ